jgi:hypothetical protein
MRVDEHFSPEQFGLETNYRNRSVLEALAQHTPAYVFNDKGDLSHIIQTVQTRAGMDILCIDIGTLHYEN